MVLSKRFFVVFAVLAGLLLSGFAFAPAALAGKKPAGLKKAKVVLGIHNYQAQQDATSYLVKPGVFLHARFNCLPVMSSTREQLVAFRDSREGFPGLFVGCGTGSGMTKYSSGHMGPMTSVYGLLDWTRNSPWLAPGTSSATPSKAAYRKWLLLLKSVFGKKIAMMEIWNEVDLAGFYRGTPKDMVDLTFVAADVFGRKKVVAPSFSPLAYSGYRVDSGAFVKGKFLNRETFFKQYWSILLKESKKKKVKIPVSVVNFHSYGLGTTLEEAAADRLYKVKGFLKWFKRSLGKNMRGLQIWDTEFNFRRIDADGVAPYDGFADSAANAAIWEKSVSKVACLGVSRQYAYLWTGSTPINPAGFEAGQLPLSTSSLFINASFQKMMNRTVSCK